MLMAGMNIEQVAGAKQRARIYLPQAADAKVFIPRPKSRRTTVRVQHMAKEHCSARQRPLLSPRRVRRVELIDHSRYTVEKLRKINAKNGVGNPKHRVG